MKPETKKIITIWAVWLLTVNILGLVFLNVANVPVNPLYPKYSSPQVLRSWNPVNLHYRWDAFWYMDIARNGYQYNGPDVYSNIIFFPLYPLAVRYISKLFMGNFLLTGWLISSALLLAAMFALHKLIKEFHPKISPWHAIAAMLIFPTSYYFNEFYTESLFLFLSITAFYYIFKRNFIAGGLLGFLAALTRPHGAVLFLPFLLEYFNTPKEQRKGAQLAAISIIPAGPLLFFAFHWMRFGNSLLYFKVIRVWGRDLFLSSSDSRPRALFINLSDQLFAAFGTLISFLTRKIRISYPIYAVSAILLTLVSGVPISIPRHLLVLFPIFILFASIQNPILKGTWIVVSILLLVGNIIKFTNFYWVA